MAIAQRAIPEGAEGLLPNDISDDTDFFADGDDQENRRGVFRTGDGGFVREITAGKGAQYYDARRSYGADDGAVLGMRS